MMKSLVFISLIIAIDALSDISIWNEFKNNHNKNYNSTEEEFRFKIFSKTVRKIESHNAKYDKGEVSYYLAINRFADWTEEEIKKLFKPEDIGKIPIKRTASKSITDLPESVDWREKSAVSPVKDQIRTLCVAGWAFSAAGALEGQLAKRDGLPANLSAQEILDCSDHGNTACDGGFSSWAFYYIQEAGLSSEDQYPYQGFNEDCRAITYTRFAVPIQGHIELAFTEDALLEAVANVGPVAVGVFLTIDMVYYGGGIADDETCGEIPNHDVLAVGYGTEEEKDYWLLKNSFGTDWGEDGYMRLIRGKNRCGIAGGINSYPIL